MSWNKPKYSEKKWSINVAKRYHSLQQMQNGQMAQKSKTLTTSLMLLLFLIVGVYSQTIRSLQAPYSDSNCNQYNTDGSCKTCSFRYYMNIDTGLCTQISDFCNTWSQNTGYCLSCYYGYGKPMEGVCSSTPIDDGENITVIIIEEDQGNYSYIDVHCQCYDDNFQCNQCFRGYMLDSNKDCIYIPKTIPDCLIYGYLDSTGQWVNETTPQSIRKCRQCRQMFYLNMKYECQPVPENCTKADMQGLCTQCQKDYYLTQNGECKQKEIPNCLQFAYIDIDGKFYQDFVPGSVKTCIRCERGYFLDIDLNCRIIPPNCMQANPQGNCVQCQINYFLNEKGECEQNAEVQNCTEYGYIDKNGRFVEQNTLDAIRICRKCEIGFYLDINLNCFEIPQNCTRTDPSGNCTQCQKDQHLNQKGECEQNIDIQNCTEFGFINKNGRFVQQNTPGAIKFCKKCEIGFYLDIYLNCFEVPQNCSQANPSGNCTQCQIGFQLTVEGICQKIKTINCTYVGYIDQNGFWTTPDAPGAKKICKQCGEGFYLDISFECKQLPDNCTQADANGACILCQLGFELTEQGTCRKDDQTPGPHCAQYGYLHTNQTISGQWAKDCKVICIRCDKKYYLDDLYQCRQLPINCEQADPTTGKCIICDPRCYFRDGRCWIK